MAAKSLIDMALDDINRQMDDLHRAKVLILNAMDKAVKEDVTGPALKKRGRKRKTGLPEATNGE